MNLYNENCDKYLRLTKKYFDTYYAYDDAKELGWVDHGETFVKPIDLNDTSNTLDFLNMRDGKEEDIKELKIPETFIEEIEINNVDDIGDIFDELQMHIEDYSDVILVKDKETEVINKLKLIVKTGDDTINKIKSKLHKSENDPTIYFNSFIESCNRLLRESFNYNAIISKYESYYRKKYVEAMECIIQICSKYLSLADKSIEAYKNDHKNDN